MAVRVRPVEDASSGEGDTACCLLLQPDGGLTVSLPAQRREVSCAFDCVLGPETDQRSVYEQVRPCTEAVINGFNATVFAYGQTGLYILSSPAPCMHLFRSQARARLTPCWGRPRSRSGSWGTTLLTLSPASSPGTV